ncbi:hypothetical protein ACJIZ3_003515 [Penstemon smallii]|uniref:ATPase AAA-type core domain-containing protein n=1 Tax=Penstemon smallii TaxID=265156 RepID=A0ABD3UCV9_9LAMI
MFISNLTLLFFSIIFLLLHSLKKRCRFLQEKCYLYQFYKVPKFNNNMQENQLYRKVYAYLNSLPCIEDSDFANLFSTSKSTEINLILDENQTVVDKFLGARVEWKIENCENESVKSLILKIRKNDKRRILVPYLQHIHQMFDEIEQKRKEVRLFVNVENELQRNGRWRSTSFTHPATLETISLLVIEDLDRYLREKSTAVSVSGILNFMDGIFSCCGEERVMVFTMNSKENIDANILRPGRIDVHINFPLCDFTAFKSLANSHLGLKEHKLFPQVEEQFQTGASLSQAEICEIMISNRSSPTRALKTVITALQGNLVSRVGRRLYGSRSGSGRVTEESGESGLFVKDGQNGIHPMKEIKSLYGLLRAKSSRKASMDISDVDLNERGSLNSTNGS